MLKNLPNSLWCSSLLSIGIQIYFLLLVSFHGSCTDIYLSIGGLLELELMSLSVCSLLVEIMKRLLILYQIYKDIKLKILEEREAEQLFTLVDSNRDYLAEFLPFVEYTKKMEDSKHFIHLVLQQFAREDGFPYPL